MAPHNELAIPCTQQLAESAFHASTSPRPAKASIVCRCYCRFGLGCPLLRVPLPRLEGMYRKSGRRPTIDLPSPTAFTMRILLLRRQESGNLSPCMVCAVEDFETAYRRPTITHHTLLPTFTTVGRSQPTVSNLANSIRICNNCDDEKSQLAQ